MSIENKKRVLYFMPDNPLSGKAGNLTRCNQMLDYFERNHETLEVDFASVVYWNEWNEESKRNFKIRFPNVKLHLIERKVSPKKILRYLFDYKLPKLFSKLRFQKNHIDKTTPLFRRQMQDLVDTNEYDIVVISYASWGKLLNVDTKSKPYLIIDTHDFMTLQFIDKEANGTRFSIGEEFEEEMKILNRFDEIWTYSVEEQYIYGQFTSKTVKLLPISFSSVDIQCKKGAKYDIVYVASDNPHNVKSINWYLDKVLPKLNGITTYIVGQICDKIGNHPNVVKLGMVDDLSQIYKNSAISICPMLSGTGVKIKVLEALSHGLPVVTTRRGVDGLINKTENGCLVSEDEYEFASKIRLLVEDNLFYDQISAQGHKYFAKNHYAQKEAEFLDSIFLN